MRAEYAADLVRRYQTFTKVPPGNPLQTIAAGANVDDYHWTEVFMREAGKLVNGVSIHYYTSPGPNWNTKRSSTDFGEDQWIETLSKALYMDELITQHSAVMDRFDPDKKVRLMVDEWGPGPIRTSCTSRTACAMHSWQRSTSTPSATMPTG